MRVKFVFPGKGFTIKGRLKDNNTGRTLFSALPLKSRGERWGKEFYFSVPVEVEPEDQKSEVEKGEIGFWIPGSAICLFFGPTPISQGEKIVPASPVNSVGFLEGDIELLDKLEDGDEVVVEKDEGD